MAAPNELEQLVAKAHELGKVLDAIVEHAPVGHDRWPQQQADWAWYRLGTAVELISQRGGAAVAASLARSLIEEAAIWDWALESNMGHEIISLRAADEYDRLSQLATDLDDETWVGWLLPPGFVIVAPATIRIPRWDKAITKFGTAEAGAESPMRVLGLKGVLGLLDVLSHGNLTAALVLADEGGAELPPALAAAVIQLASVGATTTIGAVLGLSEPVTALAHEVVGEISELACSIHGLSADTGEKGPARRSQPSPSPGFTRRSSIEELPGAQPTTTDTALRFVNAARALDQAMTPRIEAVDAFAYLAARSLQLSYSQLLVVEGCLTAQIGPSTMPFAARSLLEDGARWGWLIQQVNQKPDGTTLRALVADTKARVKRIRSQLQSAGVDPRIIDDLTGHAEEVLLADPGPHQLPDVPTMLRIAYPNQSGVHSAEAMYSILSQFVHATPLSTMHLHRQNFSSLSAPMYATAVEAACRGFTNIALVAARVACPDPQDFDPALASLTETLQTVRFECSRWHLLG